MDVNEKICKAYDIRGVYKKDLDEDTFYKLGNAFTAYLGKTQNYKTSQNPKIVIGRDVRLSSRSLAEAFVRGVIDYGYDVLDIGEATTPMFIFAVAELKAFGGAMITASHNPAEYNGLKLVKEMAHWVGDDWVEDKELDEVCKIAQSDKPKIGNKKGETKSTSVSESYIDRVTSGFKKSREMTIVVDASGGATSLFLVKLLEKLGVDYIPLFFMPDGSFSKHSPNPALEESRIFAKEKIAQLHADFGVIFDGDGDRMVLIDENSEVVRGDIAGCIIADSLMKSKSGGLILHDAVSTKMIGEYFSKKGISTKKVRVGHTFIKEEMEKLDADFAMELSTHYYFKSMHSAESAFYALRILLEAMNDNPTLTMSGLASKFAKYFSSGTINIPMKSRQEWGGIIDKIKEEYSDGRQSFEDGISIEFENKSGDGVSWWFNLRPSNTEPLIRLTMEADNKELLEDKKNEVLKFVEEITEK
ncbi:phosphomannomutase/phosphoglucomutase [Patescibacteria group bacterium]